MSIVFWTKPHLRMKELFDGRLKKWGIFEPRVKGKSHPDVRYLADGQDHVVVSSENKGRASYITSYGLRNPYKILKAISEAFDAEIWFERDLQAGDHIRVIKRPTTGRHQAGASARVKGDYDPFFGRGRKVRNPRVQGRRRSKQGSDRKMRAAQKSGPRYRRSGTRTG